MAHELATDATGRVSMAWYGEPPWHGLGTELARPMTAAEAMREGGLEYEVHSLPLFGEFTGPDGATRRVECPDSVMNVRSDDGRVMGTVSRQFRVIQNHEAFSFLDDLVGEGNLEYHTVGALGRGERVWMLAKVPGRIRVRSTDDVSETFLLLANGHDGSMALRCYFTPIRVVCANTWAMAMGRAGDRGVTIRHTGDIASKVDEARKILGLARDWFARAGDGADLLAGHRPTAAQLDSYFRRLYPDPDKGDNAGAKRVRSSLFGLFEQGIGHDIPGVAGTTWAAFQAVSEHVCHQHGNKRESRLAGAWFGDGAKKVGEAWSLAQTLVRMGADPLELPKAPAAPSPAAIG
jgi:phage/plasmid-like protein (TIGR03299 family)